MKSKHLLRGVVALASAFACLVVMAGPASAAATLTGTVTAGTVTLINSTGTATDTIPLGTGATGTGCSSDVVVFTTGTTTITGWEISTFVIRGRFKLSTTWYVAELDKTTSTTLNTPGSVTSITTTSATLNSSLLNLSANIFVATDQTDTGTSCAHGTTRTCRFANVGLSVQGAYSGNINSPAVSDTATVSATGTLGTTTPPCSAPFTTYNGGTVTVTGLTAHVTGVSP